MRLQNPLAYTMLLAPSAFVWAPRGSWNVVCTDAGRSSQLRTDDASARHRSAGSFTRARGRADRREGGVTLGHEGGVYSIEKAGPRHSVPQPFTKESRTEAGAQELRRGATPAVSGIQKLETEGTERPYFHPDVAFALLREDSRPSVKSVIGSTTRARDESPNFAWKEKARLTEKTETHTRSPPRSPGYLGGPRGGASLDPAFSDEATDAAQASDVGGGSFLQRYSVKTLRTLVVPAENTAGSPQSLIDETPHCTASAMNLRPEQYYPHEHQARGEGLSSTIDKGALRQKSSSTQLLQALSDAEPSSQGSNDTGQLNALAHEDSYSLIEVSGEASQRNSTSRHIFYDQHTEADENSHMHIREQSSLLNHDSLVTITYTFPFPTAESQSIAFILVALPPGYTAREDGELCKTTDAQMPPLSCRIRHVDVPERDSKSSSNGRKRTLFVQVSSSDPARELPLGTHCFSVWVRNPSRRLAVGLPENWWFVTFRFSPGHTVTRHFENGLLHDERKCAWTSWRQETPCSTSCGEGFEMWTRSLLAGDDRACGPDIVRRRCERVPCNINCQLGPWETIVDCTQSCVAKKGTAFQLSIRKVLLDKEGSGTACKELYPWNPRLQQGWSEKLRLVIRRTPCPDAFAKECPSDVGCRVERNTNRTITVAYPWGSCPFPCGGIGIITSIIQVANGIPRWIGEREFPSSFQAPCHADKEPIVTRQRCNTFACEDCSIYVEDPAPDRVARAWFFFLPSQEADIIMLTFPPGVTFALAKNTTPVRYRKPEWAIEEADEPAADDKQTTQQKSASTPVPLSDDGGLEAVDTLERRRVMPHKPMPEQTLEDIIAGDVGEDEAEKAKAGVTADTRLESLTPANALCTHLRTSFGQPIRCDVRMSARHRMSQEVVLHLQEHISPPYTRTADKQSPHKAEDETPRPKRPEWLVVPLRLGDNTSKRSKGSFIMWLMNSHSPRDPEVFSCQVKTPLHNPVNCRYKYIPVRRDDCKTCSPGSNYKVLMFRRFLPPRYGGACSVPQERWQLNIVLVTTVCTKGCAGTRGRLHRKRFLISHGAPLVGVQRGDDSGLLSRGLTSASRQESPFAGASGMRSVLSVAPVDGLVRYPPSNAAPAGRPTASAVHSVLSYSVG